MKILHTSLFLYDWGKDNMELEIFIRYMWMIIPNLVPIW